MSHDGTLSKPTSEILNKAPLSFAAVLHISNDADSLRDWLGKRRLLHNFAGKCSKCKRGTIKLRAKCVGTNHIKYWTCNDCRRCISIRLQSIFRCSNLPMKTIIKMIYFWSYTIPLNFTMLQTTSTTSTICTWYGECRDVCFKTLCRNNETIGGDNVIVEIYETECGLLNRKCNTSDMCLFWGIERDDTHKVFVVPIVKKDREKLVKYLENYVEFGSVIVGDSWKDVDCMSPDDFQMLKTTRGFVFQDRNNERAHNNDIDNIHSYIQTCQKGDYYIFKNIASHVAEKLYRRKYLSNVDDPFMAFLDSVAESFPKGDLEDENDLQE